MTGRSGWGRGLIVGVNEDARGEGAGIPDTAWVAAHPERYGLELSARGATEGGARLGGVALAEIAQAAGTPTYVYDAEGIRQRLDRAMEGLLRPEAGCGQRSLP